MKLKHALLALLSASTLVACSTEENPEILLPVPTSDATLSLAVNTEIRTKVPAENKNRDVISTLLVLVFYAGNTTSLQPGQLLTMAQRSVTDGSVTEVQNIPVKSGNLKVLILANIDSVAIKKQLGNTPLTLNQVLNLTTSLEKEVHKNITMSSQVIDVTVRIGEINEMGYGSAGRGVNIYSETSDSPAIRLYRNVASVELSGLTLLKDTKYGVAIGFHLNAIFMANVKSASRLASAGAWGEVEVDLTGDGYWFGDEADRIGGYKNFAGGTEKEYLYYDYNNVNDRESYYDHTLKQIGKYLDLKPNQPYAAPDNGPIGSFFYVYENKESGGIPTPKGRQTLLIVCGNYTYIPAGQTEAVTINDRYYTMVVNENGFTASDADFTGVPKHNFIKRNTRYKLNMTLTGPGSDNPFTPEAYAGVSTKIKVAAWNIVDVPADVD